MYILKNKMRVTSAILFLFAILIMGNYSCSKESVFSKDLAGFNPEGDISIFGITLTDAGLPDGSRFLDASTGAQYGFEEAGQHPETIDLALFYNTSSGLSLITPGDIKSLSDWDLGMEMNNTWVVKNRATLFKMVSSDNNQSLFDGIGTAKEVKKAYEDAMADIQQGQDQDVTGPGEKVRKIESGDLIFFQSQDRSFHAVIYVVSASEGDNGKIQVEIKVDNRETTPVEPAPDGMLMTVYNTAFKDQGRAAGLRAIDITNGSVYNFTDAYNIQNKIDFVLFNSSSTQLTLITPDDSARLAAWSTGKVINTDWLVKNNGELMRLNASDFTDSLFLFITNNEKVRDAYDIAKNRVENEPDYSLRNNGPAPDVGKVNTGDLVFFKSNDRNIYVVAKIGQVELDGNYGTIPMTVKADLSNMTEVAPPPSREMYVTVPTTGWSKAQYIDLKMGQNYDQDNVLDKTENIDIAQMKGSGTFNNFLTINANDGSFTAWNKNWLAFVETFEVRNEGIMINAGSSQEYLDLYNNIHEGIESDFETAYNELEQLFTPNKRQSKINPGDIIIFHSETRNFYAIIHILESDNDEGLLHFKFKLSE